MAVIRMPHRRPVSQLYHHRDLYGDIGIVDIDSSEIFTGSAYTAVNIHGKSAPVAKEIIIT